MSRHVDTRKAALRVTLARLEAARRENDAAGLPVEGLDKQIGELTAELDELRTETGAAALTARYAEHLSRIGPVL